ncbi:hypothetical protein [Pontibacterium sp.]|uniref:hypothetical protein n=1 Tax=Pontibacterium sp. TaxID=2036026 RepID=UPI0035691C1D
MQNVGIKILRELERSGELSLEEIGRLLPRKYSDHRDFYVFASLVSNGMVDDYFLIDKDNPDPNRNKEQLLARKYFACSTAEKSAEYRGQSWHMTSGSLKSQIFALSGKGNLYLSEYRTKRFDRVFTLSSGMMVGILVAVIGAYLRSIFN